MTEPTVAPELTPEWLLVNGFERDRMLGYVRELSEGPGDSKLLIMVGTFPFNQLCFSLHVGGYGVMTRATTTEEVLELIRLLDKAPIDHPYEAYG